MKFFKSLFHVLTFGLFASAAVNSEGKKIPDAGPVPVGPGKWRRRGRVVSIKKARKKRKALRRISSRSRKLNLLRPRA